MIIRQAKTDAEFEVIFPVMKELRPHLSFQEYVALIKEARAHDDYELIAAYDSDKCVAAMGMRVLFDFVHGKHLYIDDLVVTEACRSQKIGAKLLKYAEAVAAEKKCKGLRLCTGIDNHAGKKFYEREGWKLRSVAYKKTLEP